jgi:Methyltransferase domain
VLQTVRSLLRRKKSFLEIYGRERFSRYGESAVTFWPIVLPLLQSPKSVVDFGSGSCDWLAALRDLSPGIDCLGVDHPDVPTDAIHIPVENFIHADLSQPVNLGRRFDLAICLEVAEHLPSSAAQTLVDSLMRHSDLVLFSAAIPGQRGKGHINLQWPLYWIERFAVGGYQCHDIVRPLIWNEPRIKHWYRQNTLLFSLSPLVFKTSVDWGGPSIVHPMLYEKVVKSARPSR